MILNLNINDYYFHSIIHGAQEGLQVIDNIIKTGAIKSPESLGVEARFGCHRANEICLSRVTNGNVKCGSISCFDIYVSRLTSLIIDKEISNRFQLIKPKVITTEEIFLHNYNNQTNLYDEYRINNDIPIEYVKGICIPYKNLLNLPLTFVPFVVEDILMAYYNGGLDNFYRESVLNKEEGQQAFDRRKYFLDRYICQLETILHNYHFDVPIYCYDDDSDKKLVLR